MYIPTAVQAALDSGNVTSRFCVWIESKDRETNGNVGGGIHTGIDDLFVTVDGQERRYYGAGQILSISPFVFEAGMDVQTQSIELSGVSPEVIQLLEYHDPKYQPVQIHAVFLNNETGEQIGTVSFFDGYIDSIQITETERESKVAVSLVSSARRGTKNLAVKKSDAAMRTRNPDDAFRKYAATSGQGTAFWGMEAEKTHRRGGSAHSAIEKISIAALNKNG